MYILVIWLSFNATPVILDRYNSREECERIGQQWETVQKIPGFTSISDHHHACLPSR